MRFINNNEISLNVFQANRIKQSINTHILAVYVSIFSINSPCNLFRELNSKLVSTINHAASKLSCQVTAHAK